MFPFFKHFFIDTWVWMLAKSVDRAIYIPDILVEHRHWKAGKAAKDETYNRNIEVGRVYDVIFTSNNKAQRSSNIPILYNNLNFLIISWEAGTNNHCWSDSVRNCWALVSMEFSTCI